jgi:phage terminase large subunit-like protein
MLSAFLKEIEQEQARRRTENALAYYRPYAKQREFHAAGLSARERLLMAGNQLGKTLAGGFEAAMHATGRYPDWWQGRRFDQPTIAWVAGVTGESTRDNPQRILLGRSGQHGTGAIPKDAVANITPAGGVPQLVDSIEVRHVGGATSRIGFKSYEQGREKWQGETLDWIWFDEEPPLDIYTEGLTRTNRSQGPVWMTFTPLLGMSDTVGRFILDGCPARHVTSMTIDDAGHYTQKQRDAIAASYPPHEREARLNGVPALGSGRIFPVSEASIAIDAAPIARHWPQIGGLDFGWDHPTAAAKLAWDRDSDVVYVTATYRMREATPLIHAGALKPWGATLPWAWPHDGLAHDKTSGEQLAESYRRHGLNLLAGKAEFEDGSSGVEAGLFMLLERMQTGRLKVFRHLSDWFEEFRLYHRDAGKVVKLRDDLISATRYALMCLRFAKPAGQSSFARKLEYPALGIV